MTMTGSRRAGKSLAGVLALAALVLACVRVPEVEKRR
jgi:hypothetical protein